MKLSKLFAGLSAAALAASAMSMVSFADSAETEVPADAVAWFTNTYGDWSGKIAYITPGENTYDLSPDAPQATMPNLGYVQSAQDPEESLEEGYSVEVNKITVNGIDFLDAGRSVISGAEDEEGNEMNGLLNEWWGDNGHDLVSEDGTATIKFASSGLTFEVDGQQEDFESVVYTMTGYAPQEEAAKEGEFTIEGTGSWWDELTLNYLTDILGEDINPDDVDRVEFTSTGKWTFGYVSTEVDEEGKNIWFQPDADEEDKVILGGSVLLTSEEDPDYLPTIKFANNTQEDITISYKVFLKTGEESESESEAESESESESVVESETESEAESAEESETESVDSKKAADSSSKAASAASTTNPGTGAAALAAVGVALAGAAVVTSKKRK